MGIDDITTKVMMEIELKGMSKFNRQTQQIRDRLEKLSSKDVTNFQSRLLNNLNKNLVAFAKTSDIIESNQSQMTAFTKGHKTFGSVMRENEMLLKKFNESGGKFQTRSARAAMSIRRFTTGLRGFRMEMLSVMFFGLGMKRLFQGILSPALELAGVFEVFGTALQLLFLPVALQILDWALWFMDKVINMKDWL